MRADRWLLVLALTFAPGCSTSCFTDPEGTLGQYLGINNADGGAPATAATADNNPALPPDAGLAAQAAPDAGLAQAAPVAEPLGACAILAGPRQGIEPATAELRGTIVGDQKTVAMIANRHGPSQLVRIGDYIGAHCWRVTSIGTEWAEVKLIPNPAKPRALRSTRIYLSAPRPQAASSHRSRRRS